MDWVAGVLWVLGRAKEGEPGAASGWTRQRRGGGRRARLGGVAREGGVQREGKWVQGFAEVAREAVGEAGGGLRPPTAVGGAAQHRRQRETEKQRGGR